jgi:hypothetical protein
MKVSTGWKVLLYFFCGVLSVQGMDLGYYLMNQKDSYLANLGLVLSFGLMMTVAYCLVQVGINGTEYIKQQANKEE